MNKGLLIGYARVSTDQQKLNRQVDALEKAGCKREYIFTDKMSGRNHDRPGLNACLAFLRTGDTLLFTESSRLSRGGIHKVIALLEDLQARGINYRALEQPQINTTETSPDAKLVKSMILVLNQYGSDRISQDTKDGLKAARKRGVMVGRKLILTKEQIVQLANMHAIANETPANLAKLFNIKRPTVYKYIKLAKEKGLYPKKEK
jgi:DNA invertase Pin-like site-specific DNA recombinase